MISYGLKVLEIWQPAYFYISIAIAWAAPVQLYFMFKIFEIKVQTESSTLKTLVSIYSNFIIKKTQYYQYFGGHQHQTVTKLYQKFGVIVEWVDDKMNSRPTNNPPSEM